MYIDLLRSSVCYSRTCSEYYFAASFFERLERADQERLIAQSHEQQCSAGELLIRQGQPAERFFLVLKGRVKLYRISTDGQEKVVEIIQAGQTFAEAVMFMQRSEYPRVCRNPRGCATG